MVPAPPRLLITGGSGFLGRHLIPLAVGAGWEVHAPTSTELDVADPASVRRGLERVRPDAVAHLAYRRDSRAVIVDGSAHVAAQTARLGARLVHMSTDVVFPGGRTPWREDDPPDPAHDYGRAKADAEVAVAAACPGAVIIRTSLLYGTEHLGASQTAVLEALEDPGRMAFFTDEVRSLTHAGDVAAAVVALAGRPEVTGALHVAGPEPMDRYTFAVRTAAWLGRNGGMLQAATIAGSGLARPARVVLDTSRAEGLGLACRSVSHVLATSR